ncbi:MAG: hypothetical protein HY812_04545 [Planctomycetes bacterium]|nr:hypothetical protein [Planctomycetota bacterium]
MKKLLIQLTAAAMVLRFAQVAAGQGDLYVFTSIPGLPGDFGWSVSGAGDVDADGDPE